MALKPLRLLRVLCASAVSTKSRGQAVAMLHLDHEFLKGFVNL